MVHRPVDLRVLRPDLPLVEESEAEMLARYEAFGRGVFERLWAVAPQLRAAFRYLRTTDGLSDVYAFCEAPPLSVGLQLDPDLEVIALWSGDEQIEFGTWCDDAVAGAIDWVRDRTHQGP